MTLNGENILQHRGGSENNDLTNLTHLDFLDLHTTAKSKYYDDTGLKNFLQKHKSKLTILSLNVDSLYSKHNDLKELTENLEKDGAFISIICLQEARITEHTDTDALQLNNYNLITQPLTKICSTKGGLACYILNSVQVTKTQHFHTFNTWEGLAIDITDGNNTNIRILNTYRPPKNNNNHAAIDKFLDEFKPTIRNLSRTAKNLIITGDFNIDLLKINTNQKFQEYYDFFTENNLLPIITYPTRTTKTRATLIDHIFCKTSNHLSVSDTGILVKKISDHMATFAAFNFKINPNYKEIKTIKTRSFTGNNMQHFFDEMSNISWSTIFNHALDTNPKESYDQHFSAKLDELMNNHFPFKEQKYHKHKHKKSKWMTQATLN
jgi:exonuclease III